MRNLIVFLALLGTTAMGQRPAVVLADSNAVKQLYFAGLRKKMVENYTEAEKDFSQITAADASQHAAWYELAAMALKQQRLPEAETYVRKATGLQPGNEWYWILLAEIYKRKGSMDELATVFEKLIALAPEKDGYYFDRANALFLGGKSAEAMQAYQVLEQKFGPSEALDQARDRIRLHGAPAPDDAQMKDLLGKSPADVNTYLYMSGMLMQKGKSDAALKLLQQARTLQPDNFEVDLALADAYRLEKDEPAAEAALIRAFGNEQMPVESKLKTLAGMVAGAESPAKKVQVTRWAGVAADLHPQDPRLQVLYGDILSQTERFQEAELRYQAALRLAENVYPAWEQLVMVQLAQDKHDAARKTAEDALLLYPNQGSMYLLLARAYAAGGNFAAAEKQIEAAGLMAAGNTDLLAEGFALRAEMAFQAKKYSEAQQLIANALRNNPAKWPVYMEQFGDILYMLGNKTGALAHWQRARAGGNDNPLLKKKIDEKKYLEHP